MVLQNFYLLISNACRCQEVKVNLPEYLVRILVIKRKIYIKK